MPAIAAKRATEITVDRTEAAVGTITPTISDQLANLPEAGKSR
jgi:hypothetical protein